MREKKWKHFFHNFTAITFTRSELYIRANIMKGLIRFGVICALVGGLLRIVSAFIPYVAQKPGLEALYFVIDFGFLFGTIAIYLAHADSLGRAGLAAFVISTIGIASIVGPDAEMFGINFYDTGTALFTIGLVFLSLLFIRKGLLVIAAALWLSAFACGLLSIVFNSALAFQLGGAALGGGFLAAAVSMLRGKINTSATSSLQSKVRTGALS
jgi:hypothetical protein